MPNTSPQPDISMVVPIYNEEESIPHLYEELDGVLQSLDRPYEVIVIDDGSRDDSFRLLAELHQKNPRWRVVQFRRNFGQTAAMQAGFDASRGKIVITIDADLQNDPNDIPMLLEKMESEDYDIVSGWRKDRQEPFLSRRLPSMLANRLISETTGVSLHDYGCSLKAYRREVVKNVRLYGELHRFIPALASHVGVKVAEVPVNDRRRMYGASKYGIGRTFRVILDLVTVLFLLNYFQRPIHIFGSSGIVMTLLGTAITLYLGFVRLVLGNDIGNRPLLLLGILLIIVGVQMLSIGLVAEMQMRTYYEAQGASAYYVRQELSESDERDESDKVAV
ncbi:MAG: glycosyltransferase family 2 protein [Chloroflexota bacterium]